GKLFIRKECPEHGAFEDLYYGNAQMYYRFQKYEDEGRGTYSYVPVSAPCPFSCGLCGMHKNHTALANIVVTNRCDLSCWYCFFFAERVGYVYEPTIEQLREQVRQLKKQHKTLVIQLTGGEPLMRDDLVDIVRMMKEEGVRHIQLNTEGIPLAEVYRKNPELAVKWARELREAGVNTVYMSFDGTNPKTNPKNHWDIPFIFDAFRKAGMTSVVLVPTVIKSINDNDLGNIVRFAAENMDIVRAVNFQPVSLTGRMKKHELDKFRITIPDVIERIERQTDGQIKASSWYPIPVAAKFAEFIEAVTKREQFLMANHIACGAATYVIVDRDERGKFRRFYSITDFIDVDGFLNFLDERREKLERAGKVMTYLSLISSLRHLGDYIIRDNLPNGASISKLLMRVIRERSYDALGELHYSLLFLGLMHFMDQYNYDVQRVMRCNIHYTSPDGRVIPFCAYNVLSDIYRDSILKKNGMSLDEWSKKWRGHKYGVSDKYVPNIKELRIHPLYKATYSSFTASQET
ncbi:MAG: radical SAM protein, partial [Fervidicoccaceae archaeon]